MGHTPNPILLTRSIPHRYHFGALWEIVQDDRNHHNYYRKSAEGNDGMILPVSPHGWRENICKPRMCLERLVPYLAIVISRVINLLFQSLSDNEPRARHREATPRRWVR
jgi:hypothetical protein